MNIQKILLKRVYQACTLIKIESFSHLIKIQPSTHIKFGNYQINGLITVSKHLTIPVKKLADTLITALNINDIIETVKFEKPGFINFFLKSKWVENQINNIYSLSKFDITIIKPQTIVIDYSSPNIAKEMHVGHLRSTIIGDSIARILSFLGHNVIRVNHIGDWGTQFGMLIAYINKYKSYNFSLKKIQKLSIIESFYQKSKKEYDIDPIFAESARNYVVKLQNGDPECHKIWKYLVDISILNNQKLYTRLNITLKKKDIMGESAYHNMLPDIVADLKNKNIAIKSNNATVVFLKNNNINQTKSDFAVIIQKKDGGYLYSTTDIACIKYRCKILNANRIIYYTDSRQAQHLKQAWDIANKAGYINKSVLLEHHICGMLLGKNGKPFKTRDGNVLKLETLLNEALKRAHILIHKKNPNLGYNKIYRLAHIISIGAIKYAELSKNRTTSYIFNWDNMLNFEGNTALYIQYAYTRIFSILKQFQQSYSKNINYPIQLYSKEEISLAIRLLQFNEIIDIVSKQGVPHILCRYLHKLATSFSLFYETCPILTIHDIYTKYSRIKLAQLTAYTLKKGLHLLGIKTSTYM